MADNADNIDWINEHCLGNGSDAANEDVGLRVPVNNTGATGKPAALFHDTEATFSKGNWRFGSLNKAVVETYKINGGTFSGAVATSGTDAYKAAAGAFSLEELQQFVYPNMLYGVSADARNLNPGDGMSYRAYPTPVIASYTYVVKEGNANDFVNPNGSLTINVRTKDFLVMSHVLELTHALPYDFIYTARFGLAPGVSAGAPGTAVVLIKIQAGSKKPTHYSSGTYPSALTWTNLNNGEYLFTLDTNEWPIITLDGAIGGTKSIYYWITTPNQLPVYNQPNNSDRVQYVTEAVYNPPAVPIASSRGGAYYDQYNSINLAALSSTCSQLDESEISNGGTSPDLTNLFLTIAETDFAVGNTVYSEAYNGYTVPNGTYIYTTFNQEYLGVFLFSVDRYIVVAGGLGVISSITTFATQVGSSTCGYSAPATQVWSTTMTKLGYSTGGAACAVSATWTRYTDVNAAIANGHTIYTSSAGTTTYNGAGNYYTDGTNSFVISSSGLVSSTTVCPAV